MFCRMRVMSLNYTGLKLDSERGTHSAANGEAFPATPEPHNKSLTSGATHRTIKRMNSFFAWLCGLAALGAGAASAAEPATDHSAPPHPTVYTTSGLDCYCCFWEQLEIPSEQRGEGCSMLVMGRGGGLEDGGFHRREVLMILCVQTLLLHPAPIAFDQVEVR